MARHILRCKVCKAYTMKEIHCGEKTENPKPPKFSIEDNYSKYRRIAKREMLVKEGLL